MPLRFLSFLFIVLFSCNEEIVKKERILCTLPPSAYGPWHYTAHETYQDPVVDGNPLEKTWQIVRWNNHYADSNFKYKILWSENNIFMLVRLPLEQVKNQTRKSIDISVYASDSLLYCRENSLLSSEGYGYRIKKEDPYLFTELKLHRLAEKDSTLLDNRKISISFSCENEKQESIRLFFVR